MRILVVDDDRLFLKQVEDILVAVGHEVILSSEGNDALQKAGSLRPDLVILDVILPGLLGTEVCQKIRENDEISWVPIILVSSAAVELNSPEGDAGDFLAEDFIQKPINAWTLLKRVDNLRGVVSSFSKAERAVQASSQTRAECHGFYEEQAQPTGNHSDDPAKD